MSTVPATAPQVADPTKVERIAYNAKEAAASLGISYTTLWRLVQRGKLKRVPGTGVMLFSVEELRRFARGDSI